MTEGCHTQQNKGFCMSSNRHVHCVYRHPSWRALDTTATNLQGHIGWMLAACHPFCLSHSGQRFRLKWAGQGRAGQGRAGQGRILTDALNIPSIPNDDVHRATLVHSKLLQSRHNSLNSRPELARLLAMHVSTHDESGSCIS